MSWEFSHVYYERQKAFEGKISNMNRTEDFGILLDKFSGFCLRITFLLMFSCNKVFDCDEPPGNRISTNLIVFLRL